MNKQHFLDAAKPAQDTEKNVFVLQNQLDQFYKKYMKKDKLCKTSILSEQHTIHEVEMQGTVKHEEKSVSIFANKKTFYIYFHLILAL